MPVENANRIWTTFGTVVTVTPEPPDVMGAAIVISGESEEAGWSFALTVDEALLLASMVNESLREVVREVIS